MKRSWAQDAVKRCSYSVTAWGGGGGGGSRLHTDPADLLIVKNPSGTVYQNTGLFSNIWTWQLERERQWHSPILPLSTWESHHPLSCPVNMTWSRCTPAGAASDCAFYPRPKHTHPYCRSNNAHVFTECVVAMVTSPPSAKCRSFSICYMTKKRKTLLQLEWHSGYTIPPPRPSSPLIKPTN